MPNCSRYANAVVLRQKTKEKKKRNRKCAIGVWMVLLIKKKADEITCVCLNPKTAKDDLQTLGFLYLR